MKAKIDKKKVEAVNKNKVETLREEKTWSLAKLAREAGITYQTVSKMEKGIPTSRLSELKVAKALGKEHNDVFPVSN